jgi:hypothetical protein
MRTQKIPNESNTDVLATQASPAAFTKTIKGSPAHCSSQIWSKKKQSQAAMLANEPILEHSET